MTDRPKRPTLAESLSKWAYDIDEADAYMDYLIELLRRALREIEDRKSYDNIPDSITDDLITEISEAIGEDKP